MGEFGKFTYEALCYLMMNVAYAVSNLGVEKFAGVLIGVGRARPPARPHRQRHALRRLRWAAPPAERERGFSRSSCSSNSTKRATPKSSRVLREFEREHTIGNLALTVDEGEALPEKVEAKDEAKPKRAPRRRSYRAPAPPQQKPGSYFVNRINVERSAEGFRYSALTDTAVVPQIVVEVQNNYRRGHHQPPASDGRQR